MKKYSAIAFAVVAAAGSFSGPVCAGEAHKEIAGPFETPMDVTKKCLECHENAATDIMKTSHWTWSLNQEIAGKGTIDRGKKNVVNNFCISIDGNWPRCTSCHIGYGWKDADFDFNDKNRVDCLVCHDTTGSYKKPGPGAGMPAGYTGIAKFDEKKVDLVKVAQNVGKPNRGNCVACHGYGGGADAVKHGDIDSSITNPKSSYDVHMGSDGNNFTCQECHATSSHAIKGNAMVVSPGGTNHVACTDCHDAKPHKSSVTNKHTDAVACQTCHIPFFAKDLPTKMEWDWSTAGQDGRDDEKDQYGMHAYDKKKGSFVWQKNVVPVYAWYNGGGGAYLRGDMIDPAKVTKLNWPNGDIKDSTSKIYPFKIHKGKQVYDAEFKYFLTPKVWANGPDADAAYWKSFNWDAALKAGSSATGLAYSGKYDFAPTEMYWRINHMVVPKNEALKCNACHGDNGRLDWKALGYEGDPRKTKKSRGKM